LVRATSARIRGEGSLNDRTNSIVPGSGSADDGAVADIVETSSVAAALLSADGDGCPAGDEDVPSLAKRTSLDAVPSRHTIRTAVVDER